MKRWRMLAFIAAGLVVVLLAWLLRDMVYQFLVVPIQFLVWSVKILYLTLPHELIWGGFLILAYLAALISLYRRPAIEEITPARYATFAERRITQLARYISRRKRPFYRHRLKHAITELALQVITQKKRITVQEARNLINRRELDVPPELQSYFKDGLLPWAYGSLQSPVWILELLQHRRKEKKADNLNRQALQYIEDQMEIEHNGNNPSL